jgi:3-mercaptopyruvate sulfurtransferase SseA
MNLNRYTFAIVLAVLASVGAYCFAGTRTNAVVINFGQASEDQAARIKPAEARELLKQNKAVLVDVRSVDSYKAEHIKGAINIPYGEVADRAKELPPDKMIITYCS